MTGRSEVEEDPVHGSESDVARKLHNCLGLGLLRELRANIDVGSALAASVAPAAPAGPMDSLGSGPTIMAILSNSYSCGRSFD